MRKISLVMLLVAAASVMSGCYTKAYVQETLRAQQAQNLQSNSNSGVSQAAK